MPYDRNIQTVFEYNLEFINNKHHSIRLHHHSEAEHEHRNGDVENRRMRSPQSNAVAEANDSVLHAPYAANGTWLSQWWNKWWRSSSTSDAHNDKSTESNAHPSHRERIRSDNQILNAFGESWEVCRPCSDVEMAQTFCSSDIGELTIVFVDAWNIPKLTIENVNIDALLTNGWANIRQQSTGRRSRMF